MATPYRRLAPAYDDLIGRPFLGGLCRAFEQLVARHGIAFRSAADVGCGTGLFARWLCRRWGVPVFAVDRSGAMLREARRWPEPGIRYLLQDMRELRLPHPVDLVTANFDTLNHLLLPRDVRRTLRRVRAALTHGGHFIFDVLTPSACRDVGQTRERPLPDGGRMSQVISACTPEGGMRLLLERRQGGRVLRVENRERGYTPGNVCAWLRAASLTPLALYDAAGDSMPGARPARVIVVARASRPHLTSARSR